MSHSTEADQSSNIVDEIQTAGTESAATAESESPSSTSSLTKADQVMAKKQNLNLYEYWKVPTVTEKDIANFHDAEWLPGSLLCAPTPLEFPSIDRINIVCFESHLMCGLSFPPSKFLIAVLNYLGYELVHFHPNAIATISCFSMQCDCWPGIPPDTLFFGISILLLAMSTSCSPTWS
jgi:hypothetical protein